MVQSREKPLSLSLSAIKSWDCFGRSSNEKGWKRFRKERVCWTTKGFPCSLIGVELTNWSINIGKVFGLYSHYYSSPRAGEMAVWHKKVSGYSSSSALKEQELVEPTYVASRSGGRNHPLQAGISFCNATSTLRAELVFSDSCQSASLSPCTMTRTLLSSLWSQDFGNPSRSPQAFPRFYRHNLTARELTPCYTRSRTSAERDFSPETFRLGLGLFFCCVRLFLKVKDSLSF